MTMTDIKILAAGGLYLPVEGAPRDLRADIKDAFGKPIRRISRLIQVALLGARNCLGDAVPPAETAVYFASGRGDIEVTDEVMQPLFRDGAPPNPLAFINSVSNSACFYIAKSFGLQGKSLFTCNRAFTFETALELAMIDLAQGAVETALVGAADVFHPPADVHRRRLRLAAETPLGEGSYWVLLSTSPAAKARALLTAAQMLPDADAMRRWLAVDRGAAAAPGQFLTQEDRAMLEDRTLIDYAAGLGYFDSMSAAAIPAWLAGSHDRLIHLNADGEGRYFGFRAER